MPDLHYLSASALAEKVRYQQISPVELVEAHLARIARLNPVLNAFVQVDVEGARRQAHEAEVTIRRNDPLGPLHGVPLSIKSSIDVAGLRCEAGTRLRGGEIALHDAPLVRRLRAAGAVILGTTNVYYIWYGNWSGNTGLTIVPKFIQDLSGSQYWGINTGYYNAKNKFIKNKVNLGAQTTDSYSLGSNLSDASIRTLVSNHIANGDLPGDKNGVYFVLTSQDVNETSGFCTVYCGWHTHASIAGKDIKYSFVGNAARCINSCAAQSTSPNNNPGVDGMLSVIAHELEEAATDPDLNAWWFSANGQENADACAWTFGNEYTVGNGSHANMNMNGTDYLIQQNWVRGGSEHCALHP